MTAEPVQASRHSSVNARALSATADSAAKCARNHMRHAFSVAAVTFASLTYLRAL
jgi:hypothetical protein